MDDGELSYHDVVVVVGGKEYPMSTAPFGLELCCNRVGGWGLWRQMDAGEDIKIGGEYGDESFEIRIGSMTILKTTESKGPGWKRGLSD